MTRANIVRNIINDDGYYYTKHSVLEIVNVIFDEHETAIEILMKANEEEISRHFNECEKHEAQIKAKDEEIKVLECRAYHAEGYISDLHNNPKDKKFYDKKARSIVAMLFWEWKKQCENRGKYNDHHNFAREQKRSEAYYCFQKAYKMLKETPCA